MGAAQLCLQRRHQRCRQHDHPVFATLAAAHDDDAAFEVHILGAQLQGLSDAHAGAIEQLRQHGVRAVEQRKHRTHLGHRQHHRQPRLALRTLESLHPRQLLAEDLLVQKEQRRQRLPVRGHRDMPLGGQPGEESLNLGSAHLPRMAQPGPAHKRAHPVHVGLFSAQAVVQVAKLFAQLAEQALLRGTRVAGKRGRRPDGRRCRTVSEAPFDTVHLYSIERPARTRKRDPGEARP